MNHSVWPKLLVNLGMKLDREYKHDDADSCFRAANRITCRSKYVTKQFIVSHFCRPAALAAKRDEMQQIVREIKRMKSGECPTLTAALAADLTRVKKEIKALEAAQ
jgi:hypothetical protein